MSSALSLENPVFAAYAIAAALMILKIMVQGWVTVALMTKTTASTHLRLYHRAEPRGAGHLLLDWIHHCHLDGGVGAHCRAVLDIALLAFRPSSAM